MKRASFRDAVDWIAWNDESGSEDALDVGTVREYLSVILIATIFGVSPEKVARAVVNLRIYKNSNFR